MSKRKTESLIVATLKKAEAGLSGAEIFRKFGVGKSMFYKWREKYGGMGKSNKEIQRCLKRYITRELFPIIVSDLSYLI